MSGRNELRISHRTLARGLLLFWSVWFTLVFASNLTDALKESALLPAEWRFASGNFGLVRKAVSFYFLPHWTAVVLFAGALLIEAAAVILFWRACLTKQAFESAGNPVVLLPFLVGMSLFAGFLIANEVFLLYVHMPGLSTGHLVDLSALLLSYLAITLLARTR